MGVVGCWKARGTLRPVILLLMTAAADQMGPGSSVSCDPCLFRWSWVFQRVLLGLPGAWQLHQTTVIKTGGVVALCGG